MSFAPKNEIEPRFTALRLGEIRPAGWILVQMKSDLDHGFAGCLDQLTPHAATDLFKDRIGASQDELQWWDSETRGNWLIGYTQMAYLAGNEPHKREVDERLAGLKSTQEPDGYIGIYNREWRYNHPPGENGELWAQGRALLALLSYYELTGDVSYLKAVEKAAGLTMRAYGPHHRYFELGEPGLGSYLTGITHGLTYVDVMEWLYATTGKETYRDFGVWLYQDFCDAPGHFKNDDMKLAHLLDLNTPYRAHAVHTAEHLRVLLWAYLMTGDLRLETGVENAFTKLARYVTPSGALIGDEDIHGLPLPGMGYEYCTIYELMASLFSAAQKFGRAGYGDWIENLVFNAAQGARTPDGKAICYLSTENRFQASDSNLDTYSMGGFIFDPNLAGLWRADSGGSWRRGGRYKFSPTHEDVAVCCNPNAVRLMPHYVSRMWLGLPQEGGFVAYTYGPNRLQTTIRGVGLTIDQVTDYPFSETVQFIINPAEDIEFRLYLRDPAWSARTEISAAGARITTEAGYLILEKKWAKGDEVTVSFTANIGPVLAANGEYAIRRGPLQYVMPISHTVRKIKSYPLPDFYDCNFFPGDLLQAYHTPILDRSRKDLGLEVSPNSEADMTSPWAYPPVYLRLESDLFAPLGSTILRRATFPMQPAP